MDNKLDNTMNDKLDNTMNDKLDNTNEKIDFGTRGAPWSTQESLQSKTEDVGINFDNFIECLRLDMSDSEIADLFKVSEDTIINLRNHFEKYGLDSIVGMD